jgi:hypothetical protein
VFNIPHSYIHTYIHTYIHKCHRPSYISGYTVVRLYRSYSPHEGDIDINKKVPCVAHSVLDFSKLDVVTSIRWSLVLRSSNIRQIFSLDMVTNPYGSSYKSCIISRFWLRLDKHENKTKMKEIQTLWLLKNGVFWVVTPCDSCKNRRFGGTWRLLHQGDKNRW